MAGSTIPAVTSTLRSPLSLSTSMLILIGGKHLGPDARLRPAVLAAAFPEQCGDAMKVLRVKLFKKEREGGGGERGERVGREVREGGRWGKIK